MTAERNRTSRPPAGMYETSVAPTGSTAIDPQAFVNATTASANPVIAVILP